MPLDHVGLAVPDLDVAIEFLRDVLGAEREDTPLVEIGPDDGAGAVFGMAPELSVRGAFLQVPGGGRIEVVEFRGGLRDTPPPRPGDPGGVHVAVAVADRDAAVARAQAYPAVAVRTPRGPFVYVTMPWGGHLQLIQAQAQAQQ